MYSQQTAERMKLEKSVFGAKNKDYNGPSGTADDWKKALAEAIPDAAPIKVETIEPTKRKFRIKE